MAVIKVSLRVLLAVWVLGFTWAVDDEKLIWKCGRENGLETGILIKLICVADFIIYFYCFVLDTIVLLNETRNTPIVVENEMIKCFFKCIFEETKWVRFEYILKQLFQVLSLLLNFLAMWPSKLKMKHFVLEWEKIDRYAS